MYCRHLNEEIKKRIAITLPPKKVMQDLKMGIYFYDEKNLFL